jgi:hypothetical protein
VKVKLRITGFDDVVVAPLAALDVDDEPDPPEADPEELEVVAPPLLDDLVVLPEAPPDAPAELDDPAFLVVVFFVVVAAAPPAPPVAPPAAPPDAPPALWLVPPAIPDFPVAEP